MSPLSRPPGAGAALSAGAVGTTEIADGSVAKADLVAAVQTSLGLADGAAQKASNLADLASAATARTNLGLGSLATLSALGASSVTSSMITDGTIVSGDIASGTIAKDRLVAAVQGAIFPWAICLSSADQTFTGTTLTNATNLVLAVSTAGTWEFEFELVYTGSTSAAAPITLNLTGPTNTAFLARFDIQTSISARNQQIKQVLNSSCAGGNVTTAGSAYSIWVKGRITGATSGSLQLQAAADGTSTNTIKAGSYGKIRQLA